MNALTLIRDAWRSVQRWITRQRPAASMGSAAPEPQLPAIIEPPAAAPLPEATPRPPPNEDLDYTALRHLLDQLPHCRRLLQRLRKIDRDSFEFHRRMGARLLPELFKGERRVIRRALRGEFLNSLPGTGLILHTYLTDKFDDDDGDPQSLGTYIYFDKQARTPWHALNQLAIERQLAIYRVTVAWAHDWRRRPIGYQYSVCVDRDGDVLVLPERVTRRQTLPSGDLLHHRAVDLPYFLRTHFEDRVDWHKKHGRQFWDRTPEEFGAGNFISAANSYLSTTEHLQITAETHGISLTFSVSEKNAPRFFRERDIMLASDGRRQRIFHAVEAHQRTLRSGKVIDVAAHYRGARKFTWKGEHIRIDPPEQSMRWFDLAGWEQDSRDPRPMPLDTVARVRKAPELAAMMNRRAEQRGGYRTHIPAKPFEGGH